MSEPDETSGASDRDPDGGSLVDRAYEALRAMAVDFEFRPGEAVRVLALAKRLGLSRTPVKEALNRLVTEGLFEATRSGFIARSPDEDEIVELYEMRAILETAGFRLACQRATDAEIAAFAAWWSTTAPGYADRSVAESSRTDEAFHDRFMAMSGNGELVRQLALVCARLRFYRTIDLDDPARRRPYYDDHGAIVDALCRRDAEAGAAIVGRHIAISRERAIEVIKEALARIFRRRATSAAR